MSDTLIIVDNFRKETLDGPLGTKLIIDESQAFKDDPGKGTPALVSYKKKFGTYWCCIETGFCDDRELPEGVVKWLKSVRIVHKIETIVWNA